MNKSILNSVWSMLPEKEVLRDSEYCEVSSGRWTGGGPVMKWRVTVGSDAWEFRLHCVAVLV